MAVVVDPKDVDQFLAYSAEENLEAVEVAVVTEDPKISTEMEEEKRSLISQELSLIQTEHIRKQKYL